MEISDQKTKTASNSDKGANFIKYAHYCDKNFLYYVGYVSMKTIVEEDEENA